MTKGKDVPTAEFLKLNLLGHFFTDLEILLNLDGIRVFDLRMLIFQFSIRHDLTVLPDLQVTLIRVQDDIEVLIRTILLDEGIPEDLLKDIHHGDPVDVLEFLEF